MTLGCRGQPRQILRCAACFFEDGVCEFVPGGLAGRRHVVGSAGPGKTKLALIASNHSGQNSCRSFGQIKGAGRSAHLISDDLQFFAFGGKAQDCQEEISSVRGIDPGCAKYQVGGAGIANRLFASEFGSAVRVEWIWWIALDIGSLLRAV